MLKFGLKHTAKIIVKTILKYTLRSGLLIIQKLGTVLLMQKTIQQNMKKIMLKFMLKYGQKVILKNM